MKSYRPKFLEIFLTFLLFIGCDSSEQKEKLKENKIKITKLKDSIVGLSVELKRFKELASPKFSSITIDPKKPSHQSYIKMTKKEVSKYKNAHFQLESIEHNKFDTNKNGGEIYLKFPVYKADSEKIEIVDVIDVSSSKLNAIVVLLNGYKGQKNRTTEANYFIETIIKIDEVLGLNKEKMNNDKKMKVYIFHDDAFYNENLRTEFRKCVVKDDDKYVKSNCSLPDPSPITPFLKPREQEGDIITSG